MSETIQPFGSETVTFGMDNLGFGGDAIGDSVSGGDTSQGRKHSLDPTDMFRKRGVA